eukprot:779548-Pyramimonas_sp.AAC.1
MPASIPRPRCLGRPRLHQRQPRQELRRFWSRDPMKASRLVCYIARSLRFNGVVKGPVNSSPPTQLSR